VIAEGHADLIAIARKYLGDPSLPHRFASELGVELAWPRQYRMAIV
jgi:2,4-dienoyl-CoA reductase-like NADH-dependent reductase (Old Yellow Enzyme family)